MEIGWGYHEFSSVTFWDARCLTSTAAACELLAEHSEQSLSRSLGGKRKAVSRLLHSPKMSHDLLLSGHVKATALRCQEYVTQYAAEHGGNSPLVLIASDTTVADFTSHQAVKDLGPVSDKTRQRGFLIHSALAMTETGVPQGLLYQHSWARDPLPDKPAEADKRKQNRAYADKESHKWEEALRGVEAALPRSVRALLIQDREADIFEFFAAERCDNIDLLIRATQPRRIEVDVAADKDAPTNLLTAVGAAPIIGGKRIDVPRGHPRQTEREADITVRLTRVLVRAPRNGANPAVPSAPLWVIRACEENPPEGVKEPINWVLLTTLPMVDAKEAMRLVGYYALRWRIERFHYTLKSGCGYEKLQCDTLQALQTALSLYSVVAWRVLWTTYVARAEPDTSADRILTPTEIEVLERYTEQQIRTAGEAVQAVAKIGGFVRLPSAPNPGAKSLWLGFRKLHAVVEGFLLAKRMYDAQNKGQD